MKSRQTSDLIKPKLRLSLKERLFGLGTSLLTGISTSFGVGFGTYGIVTGPIAAAGLGVGVTVGAVIGVAVGTGILAAGLTYFAYRDYVNTANGFNEKIEKTNKTITENAHGLLIEKALSHLPKIIELTDDKKGELQLTTQNMDRAINKIDNEIKNNKKTRETFIINNQPTDQINKKYYELLYLKNALDSYKNALDSYSKPANNNTNLSNFQQYIRNRKNDIKKADNSLDNHVIVEKYQKISQKSVIENIKPTKASYVPAVKSGLLGGLGIFAALSGTAFGITGIVSGFTAAAAVALVSNPVGWAILGGALLLGVAVGIGYAYYTHKNTIRNSKYSDLKKVKNTIETLRNDTKDSNRAEINALLTKNNNALLDENNTLKAQLAALEKPNAVKAVATPTSPASAVVLEVNSATADPAVPVILVSKSSLFHHEKTASDNSRDFGRTPQIAKSKI